MSNIAIEIRGLTKVYPDFQLGPLDLTVPPGAIYGLIGPNGSGKTTTLDLLFGMGCTTEVRSASLASIIAARVEVKRAAAYVGTDLNYQVWEKSAAPSGLCAVSIRNGTPICGAAADEEV